MSKTLRLFIRQKSGEQEVEEESNIGFDFVLTKFLLFYFILFATPDLEISRDSLPCPDCRLQHKLRWKLWANLSWKSYFITMKPYFE